MNSLAGRSSITFKNYLPSIRRRFSGSTIPVSEIVFFVRCGGLQDVASVAPCIVQGYNGLKFHMDTQKVGMHERGENGVM